MRMVRLLHAARYRAETATIVTDCRGTATTKYPIQVQIGQNGHLQT